MGGGLLQPWRRQEGEQRAAGTPTSLGFSVRPARGSGHPLRGRPRRFRAITRRHDTGHAGGECLGHRRCIGHSVGRRRLASLLAIASASFGSDSGRRHPHRLDAAGRALSGRRTGWPSPDDVLLAYLRLHLSDRAARACRGGRHAQPIAGESTAGDADGDTAGIDAGLELSDAGRTGCDLHAAAGHGGPLSAGALPISSRVEGAHRHADRAAAGNAASHFVRFGTTDLSATAVGPGAGTTAASTITSIVGTGPADPAGSPAGGATDERVGIVNGSAADGGRFGGRHCRSNAAAGSPRVASLVVPHADLAVVNTRAAGECRADAVVGEPLRRSTSLACGGCARRRHGDLSRRVEPAAEGAVGGDRRAGDRPGLRQGVARGAGGDGVWQDGRGDGRRQGPLRPLDRPPLLERR